MENFYIVPEIGIQLPHQFSVFADKITKNLGSKVATIGRLFGINLFVLNNFDFKEERVPENRQLTDIW